VSVYLKLVAHFHKLGVIDLCNFVVSGDIIGCKTKYENGLIYVTQCLICLCYQANCYLLRINR
jgi:hypothetical protein